MTDFIQYMRDFNIASVAARLLLSVIFGGFIGLERGRQRRAAGLRTHILVCLGAALATIVGFYSNIILGNSMSDPLRVPAQVISGIGFLGVGTILLKGRFQITGLTTAAGLWVTAAIGISLGAGYYEGATIAFVITIITVVVLHRLERFLNKRHSCFGIYVEIKGDEKIKECLNFLEEKFSAHDLQVTLPRSGVPGNVGIESSVSPEGVDKSHYTTDAVIKEIEELGYVVFAIESI